LELAQTVVVRALRTAWEYWESNNVLTPQKLMTRAPLAEFKQLLRIFNSEGYKFKQYYNAIPQQVSAVAVEQYLHGDDFHKCRDIRYKFDLTRPVDEVVKKVKVAHEKRLLIAETVRSLGVAVSTLKTEELSELVARLADRLQHDETFEKELANDLEKAMGEAAQGRSTPIRVDLLKRLWLRDGKSRP
jgi:hypothetical protein